MIYLDNCSTTHIKPKCVIRALKKGITKYNYNSGRASYSKSIDASMRVYQFRLNACRFFNAPDERLVIITKSCTEAINIALRSNVVKGGHIVSTMYEHNSVLRTLNYLHQTYGVTYSLVPPNSDGIIDPNSIENAIKDNTYMIVVNHISNVVGAVADIDTIGKIAKKHDLIYVVDSAQSAGHIRIDMANSNINHLAVAGHKGIEGPQGIGLLICNNAKPQPLIFGGTGTASESIVQPSDYPEGMESGTMSMANILALDQAIKYTDKHLEKHSNKVRNLTMKTIENLSKIPQVELYSPQSALGVIAFNIKNCDSNEIVQMLDEYGFALRGGLHCAPKVHEYYETTARGMCRIGLSHHNTTHQIRKLARTIKKISNKLNN